MSPSAVPMGDTVPLFISGEEYHPDKSFDVVSPRTGKVIHRCGNASLDDAQSAVAAAHAAFPAWRLTRPAERRDIFLKAAQIMERRRSELAEYLAEETGGLEPWANFNIGVAIGMIKDVAGRISSIEGSFPATQKADVSCIIMREPYGVVVAIAPWSVAVLLPSFQSHTTNMKPRRNAPYILGTRAVLFPMAAGNTVVLKATEMAPKTMWAIASVFHEAGLPKGVLNTLTHETASGESITAALISDRRVRKINFTGSTRVGRIIARLAGENLKPTLLELGGKAPAIVWDDADLDVAATQCALGSFMHSGQICMSTERILVHEKVRDAFVEKLKGAVDAIFPPAQEAPVLISRVAVDKNKQLVRDAVSKGATVLHGDVDAHGEELSDTEMRPVIIGDVTPDMDIYLTESFGPSVSLITVSTEEEAVRIANDTEYGLSSAVFTADLRRGLRFARQIESGAVHINHMSVHDEPGLPHGGVKSSGFGRFGTMSGLQEWLWTKNVTFDD
ncbi:Acyl-CoA reductase or other NAD-dependent aldehyde dehydrogenase [Geosmithia morbida]|uniref:Acyl-CoA reductase or other NAD-dependent aldehyde dehydrogenase n=1 Tax=Geosmithia morbida TaxID=1094350 RepID=A0A9P4YXS9_9HYPO|nr:Acyl-CoA reductase or other NAD-dependent aldehyde dehydrogenase [Geosmithia morbida]KAF4125048.1 Acyl-CoA reductase or other NAD-dependent aldehyde dehydrogenase [Geosmithia morbida]